VLAVQLKLIWLDDAAVAVSPVGAEGTVVHDEGEVIALASFEGPEEPPESTASAR